MNSFKLRRYKFYLQINNNMFFLLSKLSYFLHKIISMAKQATIFETEFEKVCCVPRTSSSSRAIALSYLAFFVNFLLSGQSEVIVCFKAEFSSWKIEPRPRDGTGWQRLNGETVWSCHNRIFVWKFYGKIILHVNTRLQHLPYNFAWNWALALRFYLIL